LGDCYGLQHDNQSSCNHFVYEICISSSWCCCCPGCPPRRPLLPRLSGSSVKNAPGSQGRRS
jgi:hypothetical protein